MSTSLVNLDAMRACVLIVLSFTTAINAQGLRALDKAKALDKQIQELPELPEMTRDAAFRQMLQRVREQPQRYRLTLAANLAVSAGEVAIETANLQEIADLLVEEFRRNPGGDAKLALTNLADVAFYRHIHVSLNAPFYRAELARLADKGHKPGQRGLHAR